MQPIPIPDETRAIAVKNGYDITVIGPPRGHDWTAEDGIRPVEAMIGFIPGQGPQFNMLIQIEEDDIPILAKHGNRFWLSIFGSVLMPFGCSVYNPDDITPIE